MRGRKWDENWNMLLLATLARCVSSRPILAWSLMGLPILMRLKIIKKNFSYNLKILNIVKLLNLNSSCSNIRIKNV
jgi:hypothetical protein